MEEIGRMLERKNLDVLALSENNLRGKGDYVWGRGEWKEIGGK